MTERRSDPAKKHARAVTVKAVWRAVRWVAILIPPIALGTAAALQFPLVTEPLETPPEPPVTEVTITAICMWLTIAACEITLAFRHPWSYCAGDPLPGITGAWVSPSIRRKRPMSRYAGQAMLFLLLLGSVPLLITVIGTALIPIMWTAILASTAVLYVGTTIQQFRAWRDRRGI